MTRLSTIGEAILGEIERHCRKTGFSMMKFDIFRKELDKSWQSVADITDKEVYEALEALVAEIREGDTIHGKVEPQTLDEGVLSMWWDTVNRAETLLRAVEQSNS